MWRKLVVAFVLSRSTALALNLCRRRDFLVGVPSILSCPPAFALVKGSTPPPKSKAKTERGSCKTIDECEAVGRIKEAELFTDAETEKFYTPEGDAFKDIVVGTGIEVSEGSTINIKYRVMRLGKRSRDGLSGEASPVFSLGYGEDDDSENDELTVVMRQGNLVPAIYAGLLGTRVGGRRRINVRPERGWKLPSNTCLKTYTDITVVPGTQVQENDACFADGLSPRPANYAARRRMLRRYDETLIVDCEVVGAMPYLSKNKKDTDLDEIQ